MPIVDPEKYSLKRAAWAYGVAKRGSIEEAELLQVLIAKVFEHAAERPLTLDEVRAALMVGARERALAEKRVPKRRR